MSSFESAIEVVLKHEGGLSDNPNDTGGITNYGVSLRFLASLGIRDADGHLIGDIDQDGDVDADDIRKMTVEKSKSIYQSQWWDRYRYSDIGAQAVATKILDLSVNTGPRPAHRIAQRALRAVGFQVLDDGILGPVTLKNINECDGFTLVVAMRSEAAGYYRSIVAANHNQGTFLKGWLNRAYS